MPIVIINPIFNFENQNPNKYSNFHENENSKPNHPLNSEIMTIKRTKQNYFILDRFSLGFIE